MEMYFTSVACSDNNGIVSDKDLKCNEILWTLTHMWPVKTTNGICCEVKKWSFLAALSTYRPNNPQIKWLLKTIKYCKITIGQFLFFKRIRKKKKKEITNTGCPLWGEKKPSLYKCQLINHGGCNQRWQMKATIFLYTI